jgi:formamidopyrimidine-DNA glycosylase
MWCDSSGVGRSRTPGPILGIHLGMSGKIVVADRGGQEIDGGDYWERGRRPGDHRFSRFVLTFADGGSLLLIDPRRLGRVRLDPPVERLGPDAQGIPLRAFRAALARGTAPVKARLLDQEAIAGIGNLLADQALWLARINPARRVDELTPDEVRRLHRAVTRSVDRATAGGGVHTLSLLEFRRAGAVCPRDGAPMSRGTVGGPHDLVVFARAALTGQTEAPPPRKVRRRSVLWRLGQPRRRVVGRLSSIMRSCA